MGLIMKLHYRRHESSALTFPIYRFLGIGNFCLPFILSVLIYFESERERELEQGRSRDRGRENSKQVLRN